MIQIPNEGRPLKYIISFVQLPTRRKNAETMSSSFAFLWRECSLVLYQQDISAELRPGSKKCSTTAEYQQKDFRYEFNF